MKVDSRCTKKLQNKDYKPANRFNSLGNAEKTAKTSGVRCIIIYAGFRMQIERSYLFWEIFP